jgi:hypothetical protein
MAIAHLNRMLWLRPLSLALWNERYACKHACIPWRVSGSQLHAAPIRSKQVVVMSDRASDAMKPAYSMTRLRIGDVADD